MTDKEKNFSFIIPIEKAEKDSNGDWVISGRASTPNLDQQNERIVQSGLDISPLKEGRGFFNDNHKSGPEALIGKIKDAEIKSDGLYVSGYLFKDQPAAKSYYNILNSLKPEDSGSLGLSVEGAILERGGKDNNIIKRARISKVALTEAPVNKETFVSLVKSMTAKDDEDLKEEIVQAILEKALSVGFPQLSPPSARSGGGALAKESLSGVSNSPTPQQKGKKSPVSMTFDINEILQPKKIGPSSK